MNPKSRISVVVNVVVSSVRSLAFFFVRMNPFTSSGGPINRLPNEIIQQIMAKLELDGDVTNLVRLRSVSTKWKALVEDYFTQKKSLIVINLRSKTNKRTILQLQSFYLDLEKRFFGFAKLNNFARLVMVNRMAPDFLRSLLKMFPNTVQLSISCFEPTLIPHMVDYISSLGSLKQLDLEGPFISTLPSLSKLEHFSFDIGGMKNDYDHHLLVSRLEPCCVRVCFKGDFIYDQVRQWHNINPNWLTKLTHLRFDSDSGHIDGPQIVHFLSEWATSLKHLNLNIMNPRFHNRRQFEMTPILTRDLSKLTNLAELELWNISMDIAELAQATAQDELTSLPSILSCELHVHFVGDRPVISGAKFSRILSVIFPNLAELDLAISNRHLTQRIMIHNINYISISDSFFFLNLFIARFFFHISLLLNAPINLVLVFHM